MKALVANGSGDATVEEVENPPVRDTFIKIKVHAIALNPTDYKHVFHYTTGGEIVGCDVAGEVEAVGSQVKSKVKVGDRIAGLVHGCNSYSHRDGGFAEYAEIKDGIFAHLPDDMAWTDGATLGAGITTAGQGLFQALEVPMPGQPVSTPFSVLIYGGGTATGCLAIQLASLAGLKVIALASSYQFDRLKKLGASVCYDYHTEGVGSQIRHDTGDALMYAFDVITNKGSMNICAEALASSAKNGTKPRCTLLLPDKVFPRDGVDVRFTSGYSILGEKSIKYGKVVEGEPKDYEFGKSYWALVNSLINEGKLLTHEVEVRRGGLKRVVSGLKDLENGVVKGHKLVYIVGEEDEESDDGDDEEDEDEES